MDVLAAIGLATEAPHPTDLRKERIMKKHNIITPTMYRTIISQVIYMAIVMLTLLYAGPTMFGIEYNLISGDLYNSDGTPAPRLLHQTLLFQTFMLMNIFNMFNCRVLTSEEAKEYNVFSRLYSNWWFLIILLFELNVQVAIAGYPSVGKIFGTTPLTFAMHMTAIGAGLFTFVVAAIAKATPDSWLESFPKVPE